jgi:hypothetical protein
VEGCFSVKWLASPTKRGVFPFHSKFHSFFIGLVSGTCIRSAKYKPKLKLDQCLTTCAGPPQFTKRIRAQCSNPAGDQSGRDFYRSCNNPRQRKMASRMYFVPLVSQEAIYSSSSCNKSIIFDSHQTKLDPEPTSCLHLCTPYLISSLKFSPRC